MPSILDFTSFAQGLYLYFKKKICIYTYMYMYIYIVWLVSLDFDSYEFTCGSPNSKN
jgi:hypothetical protein